jgi:EAL domain-containing protein (putative c-di-GMP-specific phosphodiesterase class I)
LIAPDQFIPFAESTGLIVPLGTWILKQACTDALSWPANTKVAVNISAIQFRSVDLFQLILLILTETGLPPKRRELEITELSLLESRTSILATIRQIKNLGISIALDDFGTGYSSISYLIEFPFDKIKIDKSFVHGCLIRRDCRAVISSLRTLAQGLDILTTAEGVESPEQLEYLRLAGVDLVQGYLFAAPAPLFDFDPWTVSWTALNAA